MAREFDRGDYAIGILIASFDKGNSVEIKRRESEKFY